jgi:ankyrin repeat protein
MTDPNSLTDAFNTTPGPGELANAAKAGDFAAVKSLLDRGAPVDEPHENFTALMWAAVYNHTDIALALLDKGARINEVCDGNGPALVFAAMNGHVDSVRLLLDRGADIEEKNSTKNTALILAAAYDRATVVRLLLDRGAALDPTDISGDTAFDVATKKGFATTALMLHEEADTRLRVAAEKTRAAEQAVRDAITQKQHDLKSAAKAHKPKISF